MRKKILQLVDVPFWAIDTLAKAIVVNNPQFEWKRLFIHPKDLEAGKIDLVEVEAAIKWADVVDVQYWRVLSQLLEKVPLINSKPVLLTHHNEKNLLSYKWPENVRHIAKTRWSESRLKEAGYKNITYIPNSFDPDVFQWNADYPKVKAVGYVGRIVSWKGLKEIAQACFELGVKLMVMGKEDDQTYFESIPEEHRANIDWAFLDCEDDERPNFYKNISVYVGNSGPQHEVGTLGFIEALASGVPVVTTPAGLAADVVKDRENMVLVPYGEYNALKDAIQDVLEESEFAEKLRQQGWQTAKNLSDGQMAWQYGKVFYKMLGGERPWVSVIIPATYDRAEQVGVILDRLGTQTYQNLEAVVVWDEPLMGEIELSGAFPIKQVFTGKEGYNLAMARNLGVVESGGEILVFCDSRFAPEPDSIAQFVERLTPEKVWLFGNKLVKGNLGNKQNFVENWSCIYRQQLINAGMFSERVCGYGAMSQELRSRFLAQGFQLIFCPDVLAEELVKSGSKSKDRRRAMVRMKELMRKLGFDK